MTHTRTPPDPRWLPSTLCMLLPVDIVFRDIHRFLSPGTMDRSIAGGMFGRAITDELLLHGGFASR